MLLPPANILADTGQLTNSIASELIAAVVESGFGFLKHAPNRVISYDYPASSSDPASSGNYPGSVNLAKQVLAMFSKLDVDVEFAKAKLKTGTLNEALVSAHNGSEVADE